jgi:hypothetical protein
MIKHRMAKVFALSSPVKKEAANSMADAEN